MKINVPYLHIGERIITETDYTLTTAFPVLYRIGKNYIDSAEIRKRITEKLVSVIKDQESGWQAVKFIEVEIPDSLLEKGELINQDWHVDSFRILDVRCKWGMSHYVEKAAQWLRQLEHRICNQIQRSVILRKLMRVDR